MDELPAQLRNIFVSLIIVAVIMIGTWGLLKDSVNLALDDRQELREALLRHGFTPEPVPGIES